MFTTGLLIVDRRRHHTLLCKYYLQRSSPFLPICSMKINRIEVDMQKFPSQFVAIPGLGYSTMYSTVCDSCYEHKTTVYAIIL